VQLGSTFSPRIGCVVAALCRRQETAERDHGAGPVANSVRRTVAGSASMTPDTVARTSSSATRRCASDKVVEVELLDVQPSSLNSGVRTVAGGTDRFCASWAVLTLRVYGAARPEQTPRVELARLVARRREGDSDNVVGRCRHNVM